MKRFFARLLAFSLVVGLAACGNETAVSTPSGDLPSTQSTTSTSQESTTTTTSPTEAATTAGSGAPSTTTTGKPTTTTPPTTTDKPTTPSKLPAAPAFKEFKLVGKTLAHPYITKTGQDLLTRLYGNDHTLQVGDNVTWELVLAGGTLADWEITCSGGTKQVDGNQITVTADGTAEALFVRICLKSDGKTAYTSKVYDVITDANGKITENAGLIGRELMRYAEKKGMTHTSGIRIWGYTWNPYSNRNDEAISLTHNVDHGDDFIPIVGNPDWVDEAISLIDEYEKLPIVTVFFVVNLQDGFYTRADTAESAKYLKR